MAAGSAIFAVSSRTAWKSADLLLLSAPTTFSRTMYRGRVNRPLLPRSASACLISFMILICSINSPLRSSVSPCRFPAMLSPWQGEPPITTSTGGRGVAVYGGYIAQVFHTCIPSGYLVVSGL